MTVLILALLLAWIGIGAVFRLIGLLIRLVVMIALATAIAQEIQTPHDNVERTINDLISPDLAQAVAPKGATSW